MEDNKSEKGELEKALVAQQDVIYTKDAGINRADFKIGVLWAARQIVGRSESYWQRKIRTNGDYSYCEGVNDVLDKLRELCKC